MSLVQHSQSANSVQECFSSKRALLTSVLVFLLVPLSCFYTVFAIENKALPKEINPNQVAIPQVSVQLTEPIIAKPIVSVYGEAKPRFLLELVSEVEGRITAISPALSMGKQTDENASLITIDSTLYQQHIASAQRALFEAEIAFKQEEVEVNQINEAPISSLYANRELQLALVESQVKEAKVKLQKAQRDLSNTEIKAPFNAVVVDRKVNLGQYVQVGDVLATLYSTDRVDISVSIPSHQWALLSKREQLLGFNQVQLINAEGDEWRGTITEVSRHIDTANRQKKLVVSVDSPLEQSPPLLAGSFLTAVIPAFEGKEVLEIPATALTSDGVVWYVDDKETLNQFSPDVLFQEQGKLYLAVPSFVSDKRLTALPVLTRPLPSYQVGEQVVPFIASVSPAKGIGVEG